MKSQSLTRSRRAGMLQNCITTHINRRTRKFESFGFVAGNYNLFDVRKGSAQLTSASIASEWSALEQILENSLYPPSTRDDGKGVLAEGHLTFIHRRPVLTRLAASN